MAFAGTENKHEEVIFYIRGSVHRESNLKTVQQDATYSVYYTSEAALHVSAVDTNHQELVQLYSGID